MAHVLSSVTKSEPEVQAGEDQQGNCSDTSGSTLM